MPIQIQFLVLSILRDFVFLWFPACSEYSLWWICQNNSVALRRFLWLQLWLMSADPHIGHILRGWHNSEVILTGNKAFPRLRASCWDEYLLPEFQRLRQGCRSNWQLLTSGEGRWLEAIHQVCFIRSDKAWQWHNYSECLSFAKFLLMFQNVFQVTMGPQSAIQRGTACQVHNIESKNSFLAWTLVETENLGFLPDSHALQRWRGNRDGGCILTLGQYYICDCWSPI